MATDSVYTTLTNYQPTDAQVRSYLDAWYDAFENMGWTQSADIGQLDRATVTWANLNSNAYQIHYMNDAFHADSPCYIKTIWRQYSTNYLGLTMWVAAETNGLGSVVSPSCTSTNVTSASNRNGQAAIHTTWATDKYSGLVVESVGNTTSHVAISQFGFFFSRLTDADGDPTGDGWSVYFHSNGGSNPAPACVRDELRSTPACDYNYSYTFGYGPSAKMNITGRPEVYRHWLTTDAEYRLNPYAFTVDSSVVPIGGEMEVAFAGTTFGKHNYRRAFDLGQYYSLHLNSAHVLMTIWE